MTTTLSTPRRHLPQEVVSLLRAKCIKGQNCRDTLIAEMQAWLLTAGGQEWRDRLGAAMPKGEFANIAIDVLNWREPEQLERSEDGSWGLVVHSGRPKPTMIVSALTAAECQQRGLKPGPLNY